MIGIQENQQGIVNNSVSAKVPGYDRRRDEHDPHDMRPDSFSRGAAPARRGPQALRADREAVQNYVLACLGGGAGLVVAEDVHWFDPSTLEVLGALLEQTRAGCWWWSPDAPVDGCPELAGQGV